MNNMPKNIFSYSLLYLDNHKDFNKPFLIIKEKLDRVVLEDKFAVYGIKSQDHSNRFILKVELYGDEVNNGFLWRTYSDILYLLSEDDKRAINIFKDRYGVLLKVCTKEEIPVL